jgi:hypothetical protein
MISSKSTTNVVLLGLLVLALLLSLSLSPPIGASSSTLLISEVLYDPLGTEPNEEWIEVYNNTSSPIELTDWTISDNISTDVISPTVTIPVGGCMVIAASQDFYTNYPDFTGDIVFVADGRIGNGLGNSGDRLILKDGEGIVIDQMSYGTDTTAFDPACPDVPAGHSLERSPANVDTDTFEDWIDQESPDPGAVNVPTPTPTATSTPTATPTSTPTPTATPTPTPTPTVTIYKVYLPLVLKQFD